MKVRKIFRSLVLVVLACILFEGSAIAAIYGGETTGIAEKNQGRASEEGSSVSEMHTIQISRSTFNPEIIEINQYDTVVWRNLNRPKRTFVLESKDKLWEDYTLAYGRSFAYVFNEVGTFDFSIKGEKGMEGTVIVREQKEVVAGKSPLPEEESQPQIRQKGVEKQGEERITPTPTEEVQVSENLIMILGSAFYPETIELNKGESIIFRNLNRPKRSFLLVSEEKLFGNMMLGYGKSFTYTFDKAGTYTFKLDNVSDTQLVVTVN